MRRNSTTNHTKRTFGTTTNLLYQKLSLFVMVRVVCGKILKIMLFRNKL